MGFAEKVGMYVVIKYQKGLEFIFKKKKSIGNVFKFHSIVKDSKDMYNEQFCISNKHFEHFITLLMEKGCQFEPVDMLLINEKKSNRVFLTFDDGFEDVFLNAYPLMRKKGIPFCIFLISDFIGKKGYMSEEQIAILAKEPLCTLGVHTKTHPNLKKCTKIELEEEMCGAKKRVEAVTRKTLSAFAYPYGDMLHVGGRERRWVKKAGFKLAFSTLQCHLCLRIRRYSVPRINVNDLNYIDVINTRSV